MTFTYERRYRGTIQAVLLDWAGTTMDYGIADIMPCLDDIEQRLARGERP